jgi:membrane protease YdiL (CAAX protease family)
LRSRLRELVRGLTPDVAIILVTAAVTVHFIEYWAIQGKILAPGSRPAPLETYAQWSGATFVAWFVVPALLTRFALGLRLRDVGLTFRGVRKHLPLYLVLFLLVFPLVWLTSLRSDFQHTYPFVASARNGLTDLLIWELVYGLQFFSLEFFFRGFMIFGLERRWGTNAIFVMIVPYCMIHFHKPWMEALAAIAAGVVLGLLALRTRSIVGGIMIHWAVAISMDVLAILASGGFR